jgi:uncharacterized membrane protein
MTLLILGLILFLGMHSIRIFAEDFRSAQVARFGLLGWKAIYALISLLGFVLLCYGYGEARLSPLMIWNPPVWTRHLAALLTIPAFILLAAAYVPGTRIKQRVGQPMVIAVKVWALAHLLANGTLADVLLFGSFLVWAVLDTISSNRRDRAAGVTYSCGPLSRDISAVIIGLVAWVIFALWLHGPLIGVRPFGG